MQPSPQVGSQQAHPPPLDPKLQPFRGSEFKGGAGRTKQLVGGGAAVGLNDSRCGFASEQGLWHFQKPGPSIGRWEGATARRGIPTGYLRGVEVRLSRQRGDGTRGLVDEIKRQATANIKKKTIRAVVGVQKKGCWYDKERKESVVTWQLGATTVTSTMGEATSHTGGSASTRGEATIP